MKIISGRLDYAFNLFKDEYEKKVNDVLNSGWYVLGKEVEMFEKEFAEHIGSKYCVGVASGLDALTLGFRALNIGNGDEVIVPANTYIASVMSVTINGATPVFVEPNEYYNIDTKKIEEKISSKTKAILPVHLYGQSCKMDDIVELARKYNLYIVEDCAQSHDATYKSQKTGTFGDVGCFSFYPTKNLGGIGDGGAIITDNPEIAKRIRQLRNYGSSKKYHFEEVGVNSRLDEIQAGFLRVRLTHLQEMTDERRKIAEYYDRNIKNGKIIKPTIQAGSTCVWHQYVIRCEERDYLMNYLAANDISTMIHYPIPPHLSNAYLSLGYIKGDFPITEHYSDTILSLPIYNGMKSEEMEYVTKILNQF